MFANAIVTEDIARITSAALRWSELEGTNVLITGATGILPAYMVETLVFLNRHVFAHPVKIVALVRNRTTAMQRFGDLLESGEIELLVQDVCDPFSDEYRFDFIVHAASQASPRYYRVDPVGTLSANVFGTSNLLKRAQRESSRGFLFFSSGEVYGATSDTSRTIGEKDFGSIDCTDVRSCYGESKRMGETMCVSWASQYGVPASIVRPYHTYGPGMRLDDGRVFADFVRDILSGGPIVMHIDGLARRCFCYLADATEAFFRVLLQGKTGEAYNVANASAEFSISELATKLAEQFGVTVDRSKRLDNSYFPSPIAFAQPSTAKLEALGWKATTTIEEGFGRTVESYRSVAESIWKINEP